MTKVKLIHIVIKSLNTGCFAITPTKIIVLLDVNNSTNQPVQSTLTAQSCQLVKFFIISESNNHVEIKYFL